jgi:hypothetical protein
MSKGKEIVLNNLSEKEKKDVLEQIVTLIQDEKSNGDVYNDEYTDRLTHLYNSIKKSYHFKQGDLVRWKNGLKNKKLPKENQPAIVIETLKEPLENTETDPGSTYFKEPLDIVLGFIADGVFITFYYDKRRFEPYKRLTSNKT